MEQSTLVSPKPVEATPPKSHIEEIPLEQIMPNPENPRGLVDPAAAQAMSESLKEVGQKTEIRVRPLTEEECTQFAPYKYLLIGGHVRLAGARLAGLKTLRCVVLEGMAPGQQALDALLDNRWEPMSWWKWDLAIERLMKKPNPPSQRKLAAQLGFSNTKVVRAMKIMSVLTPAAREMIAAQLASGDTQEPRGGTSRTTQNKGFLITEIHLEVLAGLEDPSLVEKNLREVLESYLALAETKKLVEGARAGNSPESSAESGESRKAPKPVDVPEPVAASPAPVPGKVGAALSKAAPQALSLLSTLFKRRATAHIQGSHLGRIFSTFKKALAMARAVPSWGWVIFLIAALWMGETPGIVGRVPDPAHHAPSCHGSDCHIPTRTIRGGSAASPGISRAQAHFSPTGSKPGRKGIPAGPCRGSHRREREGYGQPTGRGKALGPSPSIVHGSRPGE